MFLLSYKMYDTEFTVLKLVFMFVTLPVSVAGEHELEQLDSSISEQDISLDG